LEKRPEKQRNKITNHQKGVFSMITRDLVEAELQHLNDDDLSKVYHYIKQVEQGKPEGVVEKDVLLAQNWDRPGNDEAWAHLWLGR
jgi:hypothetical protein